MKTVVIVSKCMGRTGQWYQFHFKGVYGGESLQKVFLLGGREFGIQKGEEYLMYVRLISCLDGELKGQILKLRPLEECWDKS